MDDLVQRDPCNLWRCDPDFGKSENPKQLEASWFPHQRRCFCLYSATLHLWEMLERPAGFMMLSVEFALSLRAHL